MGLEWDRLRMSTPCTTQELSKGIKKRFNWGLKTQIARRLIQSVDHQR